MMKMIKRTRNGRKMMERRMGTITPVWCARKVEQNHIEKMPQSRLGSMQNMSSAMCASSMNKSLDTTEI